MQDDLVTALTRQVKEEVIENYLLERRLIELQREHLQSLAEQTRTMAESTGLLLNQLAHLMVGPEMRKRLGEILGLTNPDFWADYLDGRHPGDPCPMKVHAITCRSKFRKLVIAAWSCFHHRMSEYRGVYEEFCRECGAVNTNIDAFQRNFDLLSILNFLRNLDMAGLEKKKILGDNFTPIEMSHLEQNLYIRPVSVEQMKVPPPANLPENAGAEKKVAMISDEIFRKYEREVRAILK